MAPPPPAAEGRRRRRRPRRPGLAWLVVAFLLPIALVVTGTAVVLLVQGEAQPEAVGELPELAALRDRGGAGDCPECLSRAREELATRSDDLGFEEALASALGTEDPEAWALLVQAGLLTGELGQEQARVVLEGLERFHPTAADPWQARATLDLSEGRPMAAWKELQRHEGGLLEQRLEADVMLELRRWERVEELARDRLDQAPLDRVAVLQLSRALEGQVRLREAEGVLVTALEAGIAHPSVIEASAELAWRDGRAEVAGRRLAALGSEHPESAAWAALRAGHPQQALEGSELARGCALLLLDRRNEAIELADAHRGDPSWDLLGARARQGLPGVGEAWTRATSHGTGEAWRQRLAEEPRSQLGTALAELQATDPVLALLQRGPDDPAAPASLLAPASWESAVERVPSEHQPLVRWWAGQPATRGPAELRGLAAVETGRGDLAWSLLGSSTRPELRALARHAQGRQAEALGELVPELDPHDPVHVAVLGLIGSQRERPDAGLRMLSLALDLEPGWRGLYGPRYEAALRLEGQAAP